MTLKLTKIIPAHRKTITAYWCRQRYLTNSATYRSIRREQPRCYWCKRLFEDGESMALACFHSVGNRTLCDACADELLASEASPAQGSSCDEE